MMTLHTHLVHEKVIQWVTRTYGENGDKTKKGKGEKPEGGKWEKLITPAVTLTLLIY